MFDAIDDEIFYRVASNIELHGEDEMKINLDLMKREEDGGNWKILVDGEWQPGPPDEYFAYLSMIREDLEDEEDWDDDEDDSTTWCYRIMLFQFWPVMELKPSMIYAAKHHMTCWR